MNIEVNSGDSKPAKTTKNLKSRLTKKNLKLALAAFAVIAVGVLIWQYLDARAELDRYNDPVKAIEAESKDLVGQVGKIMVLPGGEQPVPAEVSDEKRFADNPAFDGVKNGDKLLIYQEQRKVIIYRPSTNQIVNVIAVATDQEVPAQ
ncbi:hypothetical protein KA047_00680 [Candidatus Saccharibacteria bacterium]|jgi:hypothetical protein|nr:hypothetical protein [Candidatus Saccharibacteria bacterium]